jgi:pilus assembly protein CpaF
LNTGHEGGCGTVHANSAADVPARLEALAALGGLDRSSLHAQLAAALHAVVHVSRDETGLRRVSEISVLVRAATTGLVHTDRAVLFTPDGRVELGPGGPALERLLAR